MFDQLPISIILAYSALSIFIFYQQLHVKNFRGASQGFLFFLNISAMLGMVFGFGYLVFYGITYKWYLPLILFGVGLGQIRGTLLRTDQGTLLINPQTPLNSPHAS